VAGYIALEDLTKAGDIIRSRTYSAMMPFLAVALLYLIMVMFFTSVGFQANMKVLKSGGKGTFIFLILVLLLIILQNTLAVGLSKAIGINPLIGMCTGSIPMIGGHGTAGAFGPFLEDMKWDAQLALLNAFSKVRSGEGLGLQVMFRPLSSSWSKNAEQKGYMHGWRHF